MASIMKINLLSMMSEMSAQTGTDFESEIIVGVERSIAAHVESEVVEGCDSKIDVESEVACSL